MRIFTAQGRCKYVESERAESLRAGMAKQTDVDLLVPDGPGGAL